MTQVIRFLEPGRSEFPGRARVAAIRDTLRAVIMDALCIPRCAGAMPCVDLGEIPVCV